MAGSFEEKIAWVERVLGVTGAGGGSDDPLELTNRFAEAGRLVDAFKADGDPALPTLLTAYANAQRAIEAKTDDAGEMMDALERELGLATSAARGRQAKQVSAGSVDYAKLLLRWRGAQQAVDENLKALGAKLLNHPDVADDPDPDEVKGLIADLPYLVPDFGSELDDLLDEARKPNADVAALNSEALDVVAEYGARIRQVSALRELETLAAESGAGQIAIFREFDAALGELKAQLEKSV